MVDVLEAVRGGMNNSQNTFSQLGLDDGLHFRGPIRGVLPIGPTGLSTFNPSPLSDSRIMAGVSSYDYKLDHQGLASKVSCSYQPTSPIQYGASSPGILQYNVPSCTALGETSILNASYLTSVLGANTLMYWACQSAPNNTQPSYSIYLRGFQGSYEPNIGNMTCTVSLIQPAIFPVTYESTDRYFSAGSPLRANESATSSPSAFSLFVNYTLIALGAIISEGQNFNSNLIAESVVTFGVQSFNLQPYDHSDGYLRLYEQMIEGILEYEATYIRLIYSTVPNPPPSCIRTVAGSTNYEVFGWFVTRADIGFLIPLTLLNGITIVILILAMKREKAEKRGGVE